MVMRAQSPFGSNAPAKLDRSPDGRTIASQYGSADDIDDILNCVQPIHDAGLTVLA